ncbi:hypothetical protein PHMEG_00020461, partial [Phytophthora megakarya]
MWKGSTTIVFEKSREYSSTHICFAYNRVVASTMQPDSSTIRWHVHFGHLNVYRDQHVIGMDISPSKQSGDVIDCLSCPLANFRWVSYGKLHPKPLILYWKKLVSDVYHYGEQSAGGKVMFQFVEDEFS